MDVDERCVRAGWGWFAARDCVSVDVDERCVRAGRRGGFAARDCVRRAGQRHASWRPAIQLMDTLYFSVSASARAQDSHPCVL